MAKLYKTIYLDSCVIVDCIQKNPHFYEHLDPVIRMAESGKLSIIVSVISRTEVFKIDAGGKNAEEVIREFFRQEYVHLYAVLEQTAMLAGDLCRKHGLYTPDAIHVATAVEHRAEAFVTRDGDDKRGRRAKHTTILSLRPHLKGRLDIMTPQQFFESIPTEFRQTDFADAVANERQAEDDSTE